ncbi:MAG: carbohydrate ABC transporter permease [Lachnospiraceae bacterium]|jgi:multiple sugar transport system permease protein|nr:carbohydrate ABC transporter permease [Eubacterium sp.]MBR2654782.1 carbohydrate ABC transporter permease [Lachnospiraceae bacterium]MBR3171527.1 carbohydrate ABC transporter permease [Lachnospiraceae bacterium]
MGWRAKQRLTSGTIHLFLILGSLVMITPFAWMVLTAFKSRSESISVNPFYIFPGNGWHFENFIEVWNSYNFLILYKNTLIMIFLRVLCACLTATLAGYAFGRLKFPFKKFFFALILVQMMVPGQIFIIPQYLIVSKLHMMNTQFALLLPGAVTAFGTYLCKQGYQSLPVSLEEAAELDGASITQRFLFIMLPLTRSSLVSLGIFTALFAYKDLMWPMIVCPKTQCTTLTAALSRLQGQFTSNYPQLMAGAVMAVIPMLILYLIFQKQFVEGIATSGGKL